MPFLNTFYVLHNTGLAFSRTEPTPKPFLLYKSEFLGMCSVFLNEEERTINIAAEHLQPVTPVRGDKIKDIMGKSKYLQITIYQKLKILYVPNYITSSIFPLFDVLGEDRELTGFLLSIDNQESVVKLDQTGDVKMLQLKYLSKMKED